MNENRYTVCRTAQPPSLPGRWEDHVWETVKPLAIACFRPEGSKHRPRTECRLLYDTETLYGIFRVEDRYVLSVHTGFQSPVWRDSCVEIFLQPESGFGYFNFEFNCGGALLSSYVTDSARTDAGLKAFVPLSAEDDRQIRRLSSLPTLVDPEMTAPTVWTLEFALPLAVLNRYVPEAKAHPGQLWRANFYKCGNDTSHPHWASWAPLAARNFHDPASFGTLEFC
ncbi:MAG: carbohydrate-binding family 9-like protein [Syntrophaceae bacterium]|jgi:hypothetical protein|nr:carbohydrate-binding family 9-like protein [Syntrophaceae bacterium]